MVRKLEDFYYYTIALILLILTLVVLIPEGRNTNVGFIELCPIIDVTESEDAHVFHLSPAQVVAAGGGLAFLSEHQTVAVFVDGEKVYELVGMDDGQIGKTTGRCWNFVSVPEEALTLVVELTDVYGKSYNEEPDFYKGEPDRMKEELMRSDISEAIVSLFHVIAGIFMILIWLLINTKAPVSRALIFLGMVEVCFGFWFLLETDIMLLLMQDFRSTAAFISLVLLMFSIMPVASFVRELLGTEDRLLWTSVYVFNVVGIISCLLLQIFGIADLRETMFVSHVGFGLLVAYALYASVWALKNRLVNRQLKLNVFATLLLMAVVGIDLIQSGSGQARLSVVSNLSLALYLVSLGTSAVADAMSQMEMFKRNRYLEELAYTDIFTGFGNRNAYLNDIEKNEKKPGCLVLTFDLNELKRTNDLFGHLTGDRYIKDAAHIVAGLFNDYGKCYRIGGDEFCLISDNLHPEKLERLLSVLHREQVRYNKFSSDVVMGIACGYALYSAETDQSLEDTRRRADAMMYRNKAQMKVDGLSLGL